MTIIFPHWEILTIRNPDSLFQNKNKTKKKLMVIEADLPGNQKWMLTNIFAWCLVHQITSDLSLVSHTVEEIAYHPPAAPTETLNAPALQTSTTRRVPIWVINCIMTVHEKVSFVSFSIWKSLFILWDYLPLLCSFSRNVQDNVSSYWSYKASLES